MAVTSQMEGNSSRGLRLLRDDQKNPGLSPSIQARIWFYLTLINYLDVNAKDILHSGRMARKFAENFNLAHSRGISRYFLGACHYLRNELTAAKSYLLGVLENRALTNPIYTTQAGGILAFISLAEGHSEGAKDLIDQTGDNTWAGKDKYSPVIGEALRVELALRRGMVDEARH